MTSLTCVLLWSLLSSGAPATPPASPPAAEADPVELPKPSLAGVPGWLGFATLKPGRDGIEYDWSPTHPSAQAVIFSENWEGVPAGTKVVLLSASGAQPGTYVDTSSQHYGCEENQQTLAGFHAPAALPEGPVWILPGEKTEGLVSLPVKEVAADSLGLPPTKGKKPQAKDMRAFDVGGMGFLLTKTGRMKGLLTVVLQGKRAATLPLEKTLMAGAEREPLLLSEDDVGLALPVGAFQLGASGPTVVVLGMRGYEGRQFYFAVRRGDKVTLDKDRSEYLYLCAF